MNPLNSMAEKAAGGLQTSFTKNMQMLLLEEWLILFKLGASDIALAGVGAGIETVLNAVGGLAGAVGALLAPFNGAVAGSGIALLRSLLVDYLYCKGFLARAAMIAFSVINRSSIVQSLLGGDGGTSIGMRFCGWW